MWTQGRRFHPLKLINHTFFFFFGQVWDFFNMTTAWMPFSWGPLTEAKIISLWNTLILVSRLYPCMFLISVTFGKFEKQNLERVEKLWESSGGFRHILIPIACFVYSIHSFTQFAFPIQGVRLSDFQPHRIADCW